MIYVRFMWSLLCIVSCSHDLCQIYVEFVVFFGCKLLLVVLMIYVRFMWSLLCSLGANYCLLFLWFMSDSCGVCCVLWLQIIVSCSHDLCQIYVEFVVFFGCRLLLVVLMICVRFMWSLLHSLVVRYCSSWCHIDISIVMFSEGCIVCGLFSGCTPPSVQLVVRPSRQWM